MSTSLPPLPPFTPEDLIGPPPLEFDAASQPERANDVVKELTSASSSMPLMTLAAPNIVTLPGGYLDEDGELHTECRIREINGSDEEAMARELRNPDVNIPKVVDLLLKRCVLSVGSHESTPRLLASMLIGDRAALMLAIRILTFGSDWEVPDFPCKFCGETFGTIVELDSIPIKKLDDPRQQEIEVELRDGRVVSLALLNGANQLEMVGDGKKTGPEEVTVAIDRCIRSVNGNPVNPPVARKLSMADRRKIIKAMADAQPGPQMEEVGVTCTECGRDGEYTVSLVDLFR
jgi:hypothetical protein